MSETKTKKVKDLRAGNTVDSTFLVMEKELKEFIRKEGYYLQVQLGDGSGSIWAKCWNNAEEVASRFDPGDVVRIKGVVETFKGHLQLIFTPEGLERSTEPCDIAEYLPITSKNIDFLVDELLKTAESMENEYLKQLVFSFLHDPSFVNSFRRAPAAKFHHHNYTGGLIEHTQSVVAICKTICGLYPELDSDLLLAGAILHDVGKTAAYEYSFRIDVTEEGGLVDHVVLGYRMVGEKIKEIKSFPEELELRLLHLILSHHNYGDWGSPVKPLFAEAQALCYADLLDSQLKEFMQIQKQEESKGKEGVWSDYNRSLNRFFYLGKAKTHSDTKK